MAPASLTWPTAGDLEDPATAAGTFPAELLPPFAALLLVECPMKNAAPKPTAATARAIRRMRTGVLISADTL
jgi:hypothetical protein